MRRHSLLALLAAFLCLVSCRSGADAFLFPPCAISRTGGVSGPARLNLRLGAAGARVTSAGKAVLWRCSAASVLEKDIAAKVCTSKIFPGLCPPLRRAEQKEDPATILASRPES